jgi:hypothetical protein
MRTKHTPGREAWEISASKAWSFRKWLSSARKLRKRWEAHCGSTPATGPVTFQRRSRVRSVVARIGPFTPMRSVTTIRKRSGSRLATFIWAVVSP